MSKSEQRVVLPGLLSSLACDYGARLKVGGTHLTFFVARQIPVIPPDVFAEQTPWGCEDESLQDWFLPRILELTYTAWDLLPFARECGHDGPPFRWDDERRFLLRCELDAACFHLYLPADDRGDWIQAQQDHGHKHGFPVEYDEEESSEDLAELKSHFPTPRDAVAYIMDTFPIIRRRDEKQHGDYRTKREVLDRYDDMQTAIATGEPYSTILDPPPAHPSRCHPPRPA